MTKAEIYKKCQDCIDQKMHHYTGRIKNTRAGERSWEEYVIWGIVDLALFVLPNKEYFEFKRWIYDTYGYDVGGAADYQISIDEWEAMDE